MFEALGEMLLDGFSRLAALFTKILNGIKNLAPVLILGCQGPTVTPKPAANDPKPAAITQQGPQQSDDDPKPLGQFSITFYYVIGEDEIAPKQPANDNTDTELAATTSQDQVALYEAGTCREIAEVSHDFAHQLAIQGSGKLKDGRVLNIWGRCACERTPCFKVTENQWGTAGSNHPLQPFRTVAVDPKVVKLGSLLYVPL